MEKNSLYKRIISFIAVAVALYELLFSLSHGFRWPSDYVLTNHVISYVYGFFPRAIVGTIGNLIFGDKWYIWKYPSLVILGVSFIFVLWMIYEIIQSGYCFRNVPLFILCFVFALSPYCQYYFDDAGYYEQYGYALLVITLLFFMKDRILDVYVVPCAVGFISLIISETNAFLILPVTFMLTALSIINDKTEQAFSDIAKRTAILFATYIPHMIYIIAVWFYKVPKDLVLKLQDHDRYMVEHVRGDIPNFSFREDVHPFYYGDRSNQDVWPRMLRPVPLWSVALCILIILFTAYFFYKYTKNMKLTLSYIAGTTLTGLGCYSILIVGWDVDRYYFTIFMSVFFVTVYSIKKYMPKVTADIYDLFFIAIVFVASIGIGTHQLNLFDDREYNYGWQNFYNTLISAGPKQ